MEIGDRVAVLRDHKVKKGKIKKKVFDHGTIVNILSTIGHNDDCSVFAVTLGSGETRPFSEDNLKLET